MNSARLTFHGRSGPPPTPAASVISSNFFPLDIAEQVVLADARDEQVRAVVVVDVADAHAHAVHRHVEADFLRDVLELVAAKVLVQDHRRQRLLGVVAGKQAGLDEQDVGLAVAVVIEDRDAAAHRLGEQLAAGRTVHVPERDARVGRDVGELDRGHRDGFARLDLTGAGAFLFLLVREEHPGDEQGNGPGGDEGKDEGEDFTGHGRLELGFDSGCVLELRWIAAPVL